MIKSTLFILRERQTYINECYDYSYTMRDYGLTNSANNVVNMLNSIGIPSTLKQVVDSNRIDALVHEFRPSHVFIEAIWVPPEKFDELIRLHPNVTWVVRVHSETPFIANEGRAFERLFGYLNRQNIFIAFNSNNIFEEFKNLVDVSKRDRIIFLPNYYSGELATAIAIPPQDGVVNIGCFGSVRPLKNHLIQAVAAIDFANKVGQKLKFHINATRVEQNGDPVLKNLRSLFAQFSNHELVEHPWMPHSEFVNVIASMDISMQVSLSETFNIVTADAVINNIPVIVSKEINWVNWLFYADPNSSKSIVNKLMIVYRTKSYGSQNLNLINLTKYNKRAKKIWIDFFN